MDAQLVDNLGRFLLVVLQDYEEPVCLIIWDPAETRQYKGTQTRVQVVYGGIHEVFWPQLATKPELHAVDTQHADEVWDSLLPHLSN